MSQAAYNRIALIVGGLLLLTLTIVVVWQYTQIQKQNTRLVALEQQSPTSDLSDVHASIAALEKAIEQNQKQPQQLADKEKNAVDLDVFQAAQQGHQQSREQLQQQFVAEQERLQKRCEQLSADLKQQALNNEQQAKLIKLAAKELAQFQRNLQAIESELQKRRSAEIEDWQAYYKLYQASVFLCLAINPETGSVGIGTAFVFDADKGLLATNAHIVQLLRAMPKRIIIQNGTGKIFQLKRAAHNPLFVTLTSPDVGLLEIDTGGLTLPKIPIAEEEDLKAVQAGMSIASIGFPGELQKQYRDNSADTYPGALATFKQGWIGRVSGYDGVDQSFATNVLLQHSASLSSGTSGSPIINKNGKVIAVSSSSMTSSFKVGHLRTRELLSAAQIAFAIRIDELQRFAQNTRLQTLP